MLHTAMRCVVQTLSLPSSLYLVLYVDVSTLSQEDLSYLCMSFPCCCHQSCVAILTSEERNESLMKSANDTLGTTITVQVHVVWLLFTGGRTSWILMRQLVVMGLYFGKYASYKCCDCAIIIPACTTAAIQSFRTLAYPQVRCWSGQILAILFIKLHNKVTHLLETQVLGLFALGESINVAIFGLVYM